MSTASPLVNGVRQALGSGGISRFESYYVPNYPPNSDSAIDNLGTLSPPLPNRGEPHPSDSRLFVDDVSITPFGVSTTDSLITLTYKTQTLQGDGYTTSELADGESTFEIYPEVTEVRVGAVKGLPLSTETQEVDGQGVPTGNTIGSKAISFETTERLYRIDRARIRYTISGTAGDLGIPTAGMSFGNTPIILGKQREIHDIQGLPFMFKVGNIRQTRKASQPENNRYVIGYEWLFERGIQWGDYPEGWQANPTVGPSDDQVVLDDVAGNFPGQGAAGDILSGVGLPDLLVPPDLRDYFGMSRYIAPPYCDVVFLIDSSGSYPVPVPTVEKRYTAVNPDGWRNLPGIPNP